MKKKNGSILLFVLICMGIFGAMLLTFLNTTAPQKVFYENATRSYGFLDDSQNLHGLLELETESAKNWMLAQIKSNSQPMSLRRPIIWDENQLKNSMAILNRTNEEYWDKAGENVVKEIWRVANEAQSKSSPYDRTRRMYRSAPSVARLYDWARNKNLEEKMVEEILALSFDITQKAPTSLKDTLKDILERLGMLNGPNLYIGEEYKSTEIKEMQKILSEVWQDKHEPWEKQLRELEYEERVNGVMAKLKPPQEERLKELMSLKKIEQSLDGKTNIDPNTWQEINELLNLEKSLEKSLPQADQDKKNFLKELEQKFLSSDGQTQLQTLEEINRIGDEILKIFQNSIEDALEQGNSENGRPQDDSLLKQLEEDVIGLIQDQSRLSTNRFTGLSEKELSKSLQDILDSIDKDLVDKLKNLAISYNNRTSDKNYQDLRKLGNFREILELDKDENRLQSVLAMIYPTASQWVFHMDDAFRGYEGNYNMRKNVIVDALDDKLPLTGKFKGEVAETIKLIFQNYGIDEKEIMPFLKDLEKVTDVLGKPVSLKHNDELRRGELEYFRTIIEDFRDTKHHLDINIFKEFSSWKQVFQNKNLDVEEGILVQLGKSLTFANGIDSINFYAASEHVRQALVYTLPLRSEISNQQKQEANLPTSKDPVVIRQEIRKIFDYGLQEGNNDQTELQENKKTIQKILKLLHEAKLVNFLENSNGEIDIYTSYTKALKINVLVWDEDYQLPLHRSTDYHCRVEYAGNGKVSLNNNTVQTVEEF